MPSPEKPLLTGTEAKFAVGFRHVQPRPLRQRIPRPPSPRRELCSHTLLFPGRWGEGLAGQVGHGQGA